MIDIIRKFVKQPESTVSFDLDGMRQRNEQRIAQIKAEMGDKWILADCHKKTRLDTPRPV
jgi:hypothetical protein